MDDTGGFQGFSRETSRFLHDLKRNNNKGWFESNKARYQDVLIKPLTELASDLAPFMLSIDSHMEVTPAVNKTISRIYRDTRFSRDKSPYKTTMWITYKRPRKNWVSAPAYFFEISEESYRYGMGFYSAEKGTMDGLRWAINDDPAGFLKATAFYSKQNAFAVEGEKYKRLLSETIPPELLDWYQRKNLYLVCNRKMEGSIFSRKLVADLKGGFSLLGPFYHYLRKVTEEVE
ncbi:MAG: DUF2461 domain-containing protein [Nitrospinae bacterium]|nr:DUF2461 domain-containing protein [Nitrospinota bacterium]